MRVISVLVVDVCAIGMYAVAKRYLNDSVANIVLLLWCILLGLSGWCLHPYSDTFCMPFTVINCAFCFWLLSQKTIDKAFLSSWKNPVLIFLFGLNLAVTYNLKPSAVIPVIRIVGCIASENESPILRRIAGVTHSHGRWLPVCECSLQPCCPHSAARPLQP